MENKPTIQRGEVKIILHDGSESALNLYINCRDGIIYKRTYRQDSGYGSKVDAYFCEDTKHESVALILHHYEYMNESNGKIREESMHFDSDSWREIEKLLKLDAELYRTY